MLSFPGQNLSSNFQSEVMTSFNESTVMKHYVTEFLEFLNVGLEQLPFINSSNSSNRESEKPQIVLSKIVNSGLWTQLKYPVIHFYVHILCDIN